MKRSRQYQPLPPQGGAVVPAAGSRTFPGELPPPAERSGSGFELAFIFLALSTVTAALILLTAATVQSATLVPAKAAADSAWTPEVQIRLVCGHSTGFTFSSPRGIAFNRNRGEILLANTGSHTIEVFDLEGRPRTRFVHIVRQEDGTQIQGEPRWLAVDSTGRILVADNMDRCVDVLDSRGQSLIRLALPRVDSTTEAPTPGPISVLHDGTIVVATRGRQGRVYFFTPNYKPIGSWGTPGVGPGELSELTAIGTTPQDEIVLAGGNTSLVTQLFKRDGTFLRGFGKHDLGPGNFSYPSGIAITANNRIWVSDEIRHQIQVFDEDGKYLGTVGGWGSEPGEFSYPSALATDGASNLVVAERQGARFQLLGIK